MTKSKLIFALALPLAACGGDDAPVSDTGSDVTAESSADEAEGSSSGESSDDDVGESATETSSDDGGESVPEDCFVPEDAPAELGEGSEGGPVAYWVSQPVLPDDTVIVTGGRMGEGLDAALVQLSDWPRGDPLDAAAPVPAWTSVELPTATERSASFTVPADWGEGVYAARLSMGDASSEAIFVNRPEVWFVRGDRGESATPGGVFTVAGTSLDAGGCLDPLAALVADGEVVAELPLAERLTTGGYGLVFDVPEDVPEGEYALYVHNGRGGTNGWSRYASFDSAPIETVTIAAAPAWPQTTVVLEDSLGETDDERFAAALELLAEGGTLEIPAGSYELSAPLELPDDTLLVGAGMDQTTIRWPVAPLDEQSLVRGATIPNTSYRGNFSLEDLSLEAGTDFANRVVSREATEPGAVGWLRGVRIAVDFGEAWGAMALFLRNTSNIEISDCELEAAISFFAREGVHYVALTGTALNWYWASYHMSGRSHAFVVHDNEVHQLGTAEGNGWVTEPNPNPGAWFTTFNGDWYQGGPYTRDVLWVGNHSSRDTDEPQKAYVGQTSDGGDAIFTGHVVSAAGTTIELDGATVQKYHPSTDEPLDYDWAGCMIQVLDGAGAGQWRLVLDAGPSESTLEIERAFDVALDETSIVSVINFQGRFLFVDNDFDNEPLLQEYFVTMDSILADNRMGMDGHTLNLPAWTGLHYDGFAPAWHYQVLDNEVQAGNATSFNSFTTTSSADSFEGEVLGAAHVYRRVSCDVGTCNLYLRGGNLTFADSLVEHARIDEFRFKSGEEMPGFTGVVIRDVETPEGQTPPGLDGDIPAGVVVLE
ncbi:hypothetical protein G6O69_16140 [Pseudenhygromyxa sp. WMMC2535]|uniref:hypothetical protein n=1 Tax=Pseudenhygromyxa sp. WMMC2535 TaxID=2712867 RepID=UPI00155749BD|nr:hypothetical protein [Pseudenhygromyxa sp. WMMC2535]NVB39373.1 hypothetical protein [Pseudenhygromyxa sp. WMMC2535]